MAPQVAFSPEQLTWVIFKYGELKSIIKVMRAYRKEFVPKNRKDMPSRGAFKNAIDRFVSTGGNAKQKERLVNPIPDEQIKQVEEYFKEHDDAHIREASRDIGFSVSKIWIILRQHLKWKAYTPNVSAYLTEQNKTARLNSADWFLSHDCCFFQDKVIWSDEKYFVLKQGPNKSIHKVWAPVNPYINIECKNQSQQKIMVWVGLFAGEVIGPFWIESKMNNQLYHELIINKVWPAIRTKVTKHQLWFQQDGATCHTTANNLDFLREKFRGRLISNKAEVTWPPNSPDLNPLDFFLWGYVMQHVYRIKPSSISDLKTIVEDFIASIDPDLIKKACASARKRFQMMKIENGGRFEHKKSVLESLCSGDQ